LRDNYFPLSISDETGVATSDFEKLQGKTWQQIKDDKSTATKELSKLLIDTVNDYQITVCTFTDPTDDQDFNLQFLRLNLGALVNAGEKLNAMTATCEISCSTRNSRITLASPVFRIRKDSLKKIRERTSCRTSGTSNVHAFRAGRLLAGALSRFAGISKRRVKY